MITKIFSLKRVMAGALSIALLATIAGSANLRSAADRSAKQSTAGVEKMEIAQSQAITDLQSYVGGEESGGGCAAAWIGLGVGLLAAGVVIAATGGAGAVVLIVAGSYVPLGAATCSQ
jgi:hypothetical protein